MQGGHAASVEDAAAPSGIRSRTAEWLALAGGALAFGMSVLVTLSIFGRWSGLYQINGDFDLVQIGTALSIFSFLALTQARRGNIMVDTFTTRLPASVNRVIDAFWDFVYAAMMALLAWCLIGGTRDTIANGTSSMVIGVPLGPVFALCVVLCAAVSLTALRTGLKLLRSRR